MIKCRSIRMVSILLAVFLLSEPVYGKAVSVENQDIPVIVEWQDGHGVGENGRMIYDGWAFDPENGSYVKFEDGSVVVKADRILETDDYGAYFTDTEAVAGTLAVRGEIIKYFSGSIQVVVENVDTHMEKTCCLTRNNEYRYNLPVPKGRYQVKEAEAIWNKTHYKVSMGTDVLEIKDDIISAVREDKTPGEYFVDILMIAKYLERISDHAVNVAEWVIFSLTGQHVNEELIEKERL